MKGELIKRKDAKTQRRQERMSNPIVARRNRLFDAGSCCSRLRKGCPTQFSSVKHSWFRAHGQLCLSSASGTFEKMNPEFFNSSTKFNFASSRLCAFALKLDEIEALPWLILFALAADAQGITPARPPTSKT